MGWPLSTITNMHWPSRWRFFEGPHSSRIGVTPVWSPTSRMARYRSAAFARSRMGASLPLAPTGGAAIRLPPIWARRSISRLSCSTASARLVSSSTIHEVNEIAPSTVRPRSSTRLANVRQLAAGLHVLLKRRDPGLDRVVARLGGNINLFLNTQLLAANGTRVQTVSIAPGLFRIRRSHPATPRQQNHARCRTRRHKTPARKTILPHAQLPFS